MSNGEKRIDDATGTEFVGHEWDGIEELDTPMPRWWVWTFYITIVWAVAYTVFYPAWPMVTQATEGVLGWSSRGDLADDMNRVDQSRVSMMEELARTPIERLPENSELLQEALIGGAAAFRVNCVQCHGAGAAGSQTLGYPNLNDDDWLWGGDLRAIEYTLVHGIRHDGDDATRTSLMPAFAGAFDEEQMDALVGHVQSLSGNGTSSVAGAQIYNDNCTVCHGAAGEGDRVQGAPRLDDAVWLYGQSDAELRRQINDPRMGVMPGWEGRLDPATIRMLAAYVHSLGGGEDFIALAQDPETEVDEQP